MKQTQPAEISYSHDLLVKKFLSDADIAADLFRNYLAAEWVELIDFDALGSVDTRLFIPRSADDSQPVDRAANLHD